jgi:hypothetical protein
LGGRTGLRSFLGARGTRPATAAAVSWRWPKAGRALHAPQGHRTLSVNVKSAGVREDSDGSAGSAGLLPRNSGGIALPVIAGQKLRAPRFFPCYATRHTIQGPSNTMSGGCAAGENDRREALRFPALQSGRCQRRHRVQWPCRAPREDREQVLSANSAYFSPVVPAQAGSRGQKTEDRRQKTEDRRQKTEDRRQKTEDRRQKTVIFAGAKRPVTGLSSVFCPLSSGKHLTQNTLMQ